MKYTTKLILILIFVTGCDESLLNENPPNLVTSQSLFRTRSGFENALSGLYSLVRGEKEGLGGSNALVADMTQNGTDNVVTNHQLSGFTRIAEQWGHINNPTESFYANVFTWLYGIINTSNNLITAANDADDKILDDENRNMVIAEARAIRAWAYRHLTFGWGDVPLNLEPSSGVNIRSDWERVPVATVRKQIISDLKFAENFIPVEPQQAGKITKGAIQTYLAEIYLTIGKADSALFYANTVINTPEYRLITQRYGVSASKPGVPFMDMFQDGNVNRSDGNTEGLWVFQFERNSIGGGENLMRRHHPSRYVNISIGGVSPLQITSERGGNGYGRMSLTKWAIDNYEPGDDRGSHFAIRKFFVLKNADENAPEPADRLPEGYHFGDTIFLDYSEDITASSRARVDWPWSRKVDYADPVDVGGSPSYKDVTYLRLAETYFLKAEAQLALGDPDAAAGTVTGEDVNIDFILDERSRELLLEEHRRYTLLRTGKWMERTALHNRNGGQLISEKDKLFPVPQVVIDANINGEMPQNPGY